jgi:nucleoid-associated protein YgaU
MAATVQIPRTSRLRFATLVEDTEAAFFLIPEEPFFPEDEQDIQYTVGMEDRIDLLAFRFYGDSILWWVIAKANGIRLLPFQLTPGKKIRIPAPRVVKSIVLRK